MNATRQPLPTDTRPTNTNDVSKRVNTRIQQFEERYDLLQYEVDGWCIWPLLRWPMSRALVQQEAGVSLPHLRRPSPLQMIGVAWQDLLRLARLPHVRYALLVRSSNRSEKQDDRYEDIFFDPLLLRLESFFKIEQINNAEYFRAGRSERLPSDMTTVGIAGFAKVLASLGLGARHMRPRADALSMHLREGLQLPDMTPDKLAHMLRDFYWRKQYYTWLFRRLRPAYFLLTVGYSPYAAIAAAKEQGIRVIELQHGVIIPEHTGYSWTPYATPYKPRMPIPDSIWVYGTYWQQLLLAEGFWQPDEIRPLGSLRMDRHRARFASLQKSTDALTLLFTGQGHDTDKVITFLAEFVRLAQGRLNFQFYIKLHPLYDQDKQPYVDAFQRYPYVHVLLGREEPATFELLARAHAHISIFSTCHYEALAFGIPTIVLPFIHHETMQPLCDFGHAVLARTPVELLDMFLHQGLHEPDRMLGNTYFQFGALEAMQRELEAVPAATLPG